MTIPSGKRHFFIPDSQTRPGVPTDHCRWIGHFILEMKPDVIVHAGDHWDMPSLSSWDKGKKQMEGRRYMEDVEAGNKAFKLYDAPTEKANWSHRKRGTAEYKPEKHLMRGNHEDRIRRAIEGDAFLDGALSFDHLESPGWIVHDFLVPFFSDGVGYSHYWTNSMGRPISGMPETMLKTIGHSFVAGHQQTLKVGNRFIQSPDGPKQQRALVAGASYQHTEDYLGPQGNAHWRGIIVMNEVNDGDYALMEITLDYLCRKYEGVPLKQFMDETYEVVKIPMEQY